MEHYSMRASSSFLKRLMKRTPWGTVAKHKFVLGNRCSILLSYGTVREHAYHT